MPEALKKVMLGSASVTLLAVGGLVAGLFVAPERAYADWCDWDVCSEESGNCFASDVKWQCKETSGGCEDKGCDPE